MRVVERVAVTLPADLVRDIERREKNRSKFVAEAVPRGLDRRRRKDLRRSLENPHPESAELAEKGLAESSRGLPEEDAEALVDSGLGGGTGVQLGRGAMVLVELDPLLVTNNLAYGLASY